MDFMDHEPLYASADGLEYHPLKPLKAEAYREMFRSAELV